MIKVLLFAITAICYVQAYNRTPLGEDIDKTSMEFFQEAYKLQQDKNVVSSPLGVMLLLSIYGEGAGEESRKEINALLGGGEYSQVSNEYSGLSRNLSKMNPNVFTLDNKIYIADKYSLNKEFTNTARQYESEVETIDFKDLEKAADIINKWASKKTKGYIESAVTPGAIDPDVIVALFNVIFFKGDWQKPFKEWNTKNKDFYINSKTVVQKPTMNLEMSLLYTVNKELEVRMVELPYEEPGFRMVIVLPDKVDGLQSVLEKASQKGLLNDILRMKRFSGLINLEMPKFQIKTSLNLNDLLPQVGVSKIFYEPAPGIVQDGSVRVFTASQEAFIEVDEKGTIAVAVTLIGGGGSSYTPPSEIIDFKVNHPFAYLILHEDKIIFAGTYTH